MFPFDHPSDYTLVIDFLLAVALLFYFSLGEPRVWFKDRLGWVIFGYALVTVAFIGLIAYAIVFGQKVAEPIRFIVGAGMGAALALKIFAVYRERREGRQAGVRPIPIERKMMSTNSTQQDAVKSATEIWYKGKRVLRTLVQTIIPSFLGFAVVLPMIIEALGLPVDSELRLWLLAVAAGVTAVATGIARVMAIPAVNAWLIKIGLGSVPADAVEVRTYAHGAPVIVKPDPKVEEPFFIGTTPAPVEPAVKPWEADPNG